MSFSLEGLVCLDVVCEPPYGPSSCDERHDQASPAEYLEPHPSAGVPGHFGLCNVHLYGEVHGQRVERSRPNQTEEVVEEWEDHRDHCCHYHVQCSPHQSKGVEAVNSAERNVDSMLCGDQFVFRPFLPAAVLHKAEYRLCEHLVSSNEVDGNAYIGEVDQPERLVEPESGEKVSGSVVSEGGIADATAEGIE